MGVALGLRRMGVRRGVVGALVVGSSSVCPDEGIAFSYQKVNYHRVPRYGWIGSSGRQGSAAQAAPGRRRQPAMSRMKL